jgi:hypothetical protein
VAEMILRDSNEQTCVIPNMRPSRRLSPSIWLDDLEAYVAAGYAKPRRGNAIRLIRRSEYSKAILDRVAELQAPALALGGTRLARVLAEMENIATFSLGSCMEARCQGRTGAQS